MRIVFWQNCLSMHQLPFVAKLPDCNGVESVTFVAGEDVDGERKAMGWSVPQIDGLERCEVLVNPDNKKIKELFENHATETIHLFSGIRGFAFVFKVFKMSLNYELTRGLIVERPNTFAYGRANGKPLWMHRIKYWLQDAKYSKYIKYVFAMGEDAVHYYRSLCNKWQVFPFAYCVEVKGGDAAAAAASTTLDCLFVGSLTWWKSAKTLLTSYTLLPHDTRVRVKILIVGDGPQREMLETFTRSNNLQGVEFAGTVANDKIGEALSRSDVLILPSVYDGWGAVINEALSAGCYAIATDKCGAKELLRDERCGRVFRGGNAKELATILSHCQANLEELRATRSWRKDWTKQCISGSAIAKYMVDCLQGKKAIRPWYKQ